MIIYNDNNNNNKCYTNDVGLIWWCIMEVLCLNSDQETSLRLCFSEFFLVLRESIKLVQ
jgi:hypothetical protein